MPLGLSLTPPRVQKRRFSTIMIKQKRMCSVWKVFTPSNHF